MIHSAIVRPSIRRPLISLLPQTGSPVLCLHEIYSLPLSDFNFCKNTFLASFAVRDVKLDTNAEAKGTAAPLNVKSSERTAHQFFVSEKESDI